MEPKPGDKVTTPQGEGVVKAAMGGNVIVTLTDGTRVLVKITDLKGS